MEYNHRVFHVHLEPDISDNVITRKTLPTIGLCVTFVSIMFFHYVSLVDYPMPSCDENFYGRSALKFFDAVFSGERWPAANSAFFLFHGRGYWLLLGIAFSLLGPTLFAARIVSLLGLLLFIIATFFVGKLYVNRTVGLWSSLLVSVAWLSMHSGHLARPDVLSSAVGTASVALAKYVTNNHHWRNFLLLGVVLSAQIEIHPLSIHLVLPILLMTTVFVFRKRLWIQMLATILGIATALGFILLGRYGADTVAVVSGFIGGNDLLVEFVRGDSSANQTNLLDSVGTFLRFWWDSYAWLAPFVSTPQALFFLFGLIFAWVRGSAGLRGLASIVIVSSVSFALTNRTHSWLGYSLLWLPYYTVMWVTAVMGFRVLSRWIWLNHNLARVVLVLHGFVYLVGDVYLLRGDREKTEEIYYTEANQILAGIPRGARVLAKQYWWYAMRDKVTFLDENLVAPRGSLAWWIGVPDDIAYPRQRVDLDTQVSEQFDGELRPDFVVVDGVLGCMDVRDENYNAFIGVVQSRCKLNKQIHSNLYRVQHVYQCVS